MLFHGDHLVHVKNSIWHFRHWCTLHGSIHPVGNSIPWGLSGLCQKSFPNFGPWCTLCGSIHPDGNSIPWGLSSLCQKFYLKFQTFMHFMFNMLSVSPLKMQLKKCLNLCLACWIQNLFIVNGTTNYMSEKKSWLQTFVVSGSGDYKIL